jgi:enoyl-CoA hydratase
MNDANEVVQERHGAVLVLRLNRPEVRNALSWGMMDAIGSAVAAAESDPEIRAVVLTGTGDRAFCAGMDLRAYAGGDDVSQEERERATAAYVRVLDGEVTVPLVAAVNASALAGGLELMLGCDVVVTSSEAKFGLPEVKRGLFAGSGVLHLGRRVPLGIALELCLTGDSIDAARAYELGLVNAAVAPDAVFATALGIAERIAANGPLAIAATKELVRASVSDPGRASQRLPELVAAVFGSDDAKEGARAFMEKREPQWQGR